ncbi:MAG: hypothetical protein LBR81_05140 [Prevotellaceae bacterium]|jgi:membrane-associated phospholipid phosphatase|nr:hypothetical protein [Prevotellaceae bacterium]
MKIFAHIISTIFQPLLMPTYGMLLLLLTGEFYWHIALLYIGFIFLLTAILPLVFILVLKRLGFISSIQLTDRKERRLPYLFAILSYFLALALLWYSYFPVYVLTTMLGCVTATIVVSIITRWWKISAHLCAMGCLCAAILVVSILLKKDSAALLSVAFVMAGMVASARLILRVHTPLQTLAGFAVGFLFVTGFGMIFLVNN